VEENGWRDVQGNPGSRSDGRSRRRGRGENSSFGAGAYGGLDGRLVRPPAAYRRSKERPADAKAENAGQCDGRGLAG